MADLTINYNPPVKSGRLRKWPRNRMSSSMQNSTNFDQDSFSRWHDERRVPIIIICALNAPFSITAVLENVLVIYSLWNSVLLHSPSIVVLFCLAICDLGVGLVVQPLYIIYQTFYVTKRWQTWLLALKAFNIVANFFSGMSFLTTTVVSVDRYLAIHLHLRYQELVTVRRTIQLLLVLWLTATFIALSLLWKASITFFAALAVIIVCLFITSASYIKIFLVVRNHKKRIEDQTQNAPEQHHQSTRDTARQIKSSVSMFYICITHLFCYLPYFVFLILRDGYATTNFSIIAVEFGQTLVFLNSSLNPLLYCWRLREVRAAVKRSFVVLGCRVFIQDASQGIST